MSPPRYFLNSKGDAYGVFIDLRCGLFSLKAAPRKISPRKISAAADYDSDDDWPV